MSSSRLRPRPSAGVSSLVAPVATVGLDQVAREDLTAAEVDHGDLVLVDDGEDPPAGMGHAELEVVQAAGLAQGEGAGLVDEVAAQAKVTPGARAGGQRLGCRAVGLGRGPSADGPVRPLLVVGVAEGIELARARLEPSLKAAGFKRTPKAAPASWSRPEGELWLTFWFQPRSSNDAYSAAYRFTMEFLLGPEPKIYGHGFRQRFPVLLTDEGREQLRQLENQVIVELPLPDMRFIGGLPPSTQEHVLGGWRPRSNIWPR